MTFDREPGASAPGADSSRDPQPLRWIALPILLALATLVRFLSLPGRGIFDTDQGRDFLVLRAMLADGVIPLLGPPTSIGGVHHGAAYYYLLAPLAWASGLDPTIVTALFAAAGVGAVALVWWLARSMGGAVAGFVAGLLLALSPTAIAASVTIWNPNLIGLSASLAMATAWRAWTSGQPRWWVLAIGALGLTIQLHIIALVFALPVVGLLLADVRRTPAGPARQPLVQAMLGGIGLASILFVPLLIHELATGFSEIRAAIAFVAGGGGATLDPVSRLIIVVLRMASWPILGLIVDAPLAAILLTGFVVVLCAWRARAATGVERTGVRWLVAILAVAAVGLTVLVPDLATVTRGLPNDQYHAFTDPIIFVIVGLGVAGILGAGRAASPGGWRRQQAERILVFAGLLVILTVELIRLPLRDDPDGGWPAAGRAAERVARATAAETILVMGIPDFKPTSGFIFPLLRAGRYVVDGRAAVQGTQAVEGTLPEPPGAPRALVVVCDRLYEAVVGLPCGGPAEEALSHPDFSRLVDRFDLSGRTSISIYLPPGITAR